MIEILALTMPLLVAGQRDDFPFLPDDMCVDYSIRKDAARSDCPEYFVVDPKTGKLEPIPLPKIMDYDYAFMVNGLVMLGKISLKRK